MASLTSYDYARYESSLPGGKFSLKHRKCVVLTNVLITGRLMDLVDYIRRRPKKNNNSEAVKKATQILQQQYNALGPVS